MFALLPSSQVFLTHRVSTFSFSKVSPRNEAVDNSVNIHGDRILQHFAPHYPGQHLAFSMCKTAHYAVAEVETER